MLSVSSCRTTRKRRSAQRRSKCHFTPSGTPPGEQQIGHIGAGDQQHEGDATHQHQQCWLYSARECIIECLQINAKTHIAGRIFAVQASRNPIKFSLCRRIKPPSQ
jgi:hypothetical protein